MFNVHVEMPSGAKSVGFERDTKDEAQKVFESMVRQMREWKNFAAEVVMTDGEKEIRRERIPNVS